MARTRTIVPRPRRRSPDGPRILFLDDDPGRAAAFLAAHPAAVWVRTAEQCLARLEEAWDEVHLDHDLGGEVLVDTGREDCGMAVVRWLCLVPQAHLRDTRFVIHSHNVNAAWLMVKQLQAMGLDVRACPFGTSPRGSAPAAGPGGWWRRARRVLRWLRRPAHEASARPSRPAPDSP
jgi:hypothetical protein